jgi:hypothetical protein
MLLAEAFDGDEAVRLGLANAASGTRPRSTNGIRNRAEGAT